jgi:hypothetical protein
MTRAARISCLILGAVWLCLPQQAPAQEIDSEPACGVVFDRWDDTSAPRQIVDARGTGHEFAAAEDCLGRKDPAAACAHWERVRARLSRMPEIAAMIGDALPQKMSENGCH